MKYSNGKIRQYIELEYEITYDSLRNKSLRKLPKKIRDNIVDLHDRSNYRPKEVILELEELAAKYSNVPILMNYLSAAYSRIGDFENSEKHVIENYKRHSSYLFAKINYAQICLEKEEYEKIPIIFDNKYDLKLLYPNRNKFHFTEFVSFNGIICRYYIEIGELEKAESYYNLLRSIAPKHSTTKIIRRVLYPSFYRKIMNKISEKLENKIKDYEERQKKINNIESS